MKTIVVDNNDRLSLQKQIAAQQPKAGDTLRFLSANSEDIAVTVLLAVVSHMTHSHNERSDFAVQILNELFQDKSLEDLERDIEDEYGLKIEINPFNEESIYENVPRTNYTLQSDEDVIKQFQERALISWGGKIDADEFLNEIRGSE